MRRRRHEPACGAVSAGSRELNPGVAQLPGAGLPVASRQEAFRISFDGERELAAGLRTFPGLGSLPRHEPALKVLIARRVPDA
jgi:hypothetical protein